MGRQLFNDGMEVVFEDFNRLQARVQKEFYDRVVFELIQKAENAFFGNSHKVLFATPTSVTVQAGIGFQTDTTVVSSEPQKRLLYLASNQVANISAPDTVNNRIDLVCVKHSLVDGTPESRKFKNATTSLISTESLNTVKEWASEILIIDGTPSGSPVAPAVPSGYLKIAELTVVAVSGIADQLAITDTRTLMPLGSLATIDSSAFNLLTQSAALTLQQALGEVDGYLREGFALTNTFADLVSDPTAPAVSGQRILYNKGGLLFVRESNPEGGAVTPVGAGAGGGGGGANWQGSALDAIENGEKVWKFTQGDTQSVTLFIKVPSGYLAGRQITSYLGFYSPSATNLWKMQLTTTLIRKGQDAITSLTNQNTANTGDITNDQANEYRELNVNLTTGIGQINGFSVSPGDLLKVTLSRIAPVGTEDTAEIRFIPSTTEVKFG